MASSWSWMLPSHLDAGGRAGSFDKGESVQVYECRLVEVGSDVAASQDP